VIRKYITYSPLLFLFNLSFLLLFFPDNLATLVEEELAGGGDCVGVPLDCDTQKLTKEVKLCTSKI